MLKPFRNREIFAALAYLSQTQRRLFDQLREMDRDPSIIFAFDKAELIQIPAVLGNFGAAGEEFDIPGVLAAASEAYDCFNEISSAPITRNDLSRLHSLMDGLRATFINVIKDTMLLNVSRDSVRYYDGDRLGFGAEVEDAFPSSTDDAREVSRCRALERWTASVMHCMRALEPALIALGNRVGVSLPKPEWWKIIKAIKVKVEAAKASGQHDALQFESVASSYFRDVKDGWRNHTMHAKMSFGEDDAIAAYDATRSLMRHLSKELSEAN